MEKKRQSINFAESRSETSRNSRNINYNVFWSNLGYFSTSLLFAEYFLCVARKLATFGDIYNSSGNFNIEGNKVLVECVNIWTRWNSVSLLNFQILW